MKLISDLAAWRRARAELASCSVGFVATMGALHEGHVSLLRRSVAENDRTVISVFVNAPQFNEATDFEGYPRLLADDARLAADAGADLLLAPDHAAIYPDDFRYRLTESHLGRTMEGAHRPGHFDGVLTVVLKLLQLVRPDRAYFGEKDYQQVLLIDGMVKALFVSTEIVPCATVRDPDGLALSSRNASLSRDGRRRAADFPRLLATGLPPETVRTRLEDAGFEVDYVTDFEGRRFGAVHLEGVRLIDNLVLE